ncbi:cupin domain-containing protein [Hymenobacter sp. H14-R3]|uniref:cupin domain-containing protein n=1 Tax=Hymenobacter sp. H14-R3 TaxID=3046308 RepID=UPI0024BA60A1|nr:cupin domain-containing protein [Hymenobacter sp. H14-R3]MDJ0366555.1 cupin domain-containing protein [Hymenobacter sp. H14-R3]
MNQPLIKWNSSPAAAPLSGAPTPYVLNRQTAPAFWLVGTLWLVMASGRQTGNRLSLLEQLMPAGLGPATHRHPWAVEGFYVLEGTCSFNAQGKTVMAGPGTFVLLPRCLPHSFSVDSSQARVLNCYTPAGFELVVMSLGQPALERRMPSMAESAPTHSHEQIQILSALYGQEAVTALPFLGPPSPELLVTQDSDTGHGALRVTTAAEAQSTVLFGLSWYPLVTAADTEGTYDLFEVAAPAGAGPPWQISQQDEALYVLAGTLLLHLDGQQQRVAAGSWAYFPAGTSFRWHAEDVAARLLVFHLPGDAGGSSAPGFPAG